MVGTKPGDCMSRGSKGIHQATRCLGRGKAEQGQGGSGGTEKFSRVSNIR